MKNLLRPGVWHFGPMVLAAGCLAGLSVGTLRAADRVLEIDSGKLARDPAVFQVEWTGGDVAAVEEPGAAGRAARPVEFQLDRTTPARLWIRLPDPLAAGEKRRLTVKEGVTPQVAAVVKAEQAAGSLGISIAGRPVLTYHDAPVPVPEGVALHDPKLRREAFARSAYIHPIFTPSGRKVTEDFPLDHTHHKGLWMPWTRTRFDGKDVDFWNLGAETGTVEFRSYGRVESGAIFGGFTALHEHVMLKPMRRGVLNEKWEVRVHERVIGGRAVWVLDLVSTQRCATDKPLEFPEYRYGGLGFRGARGWTDAEHQVLSSEGKTKKDGHATRARWCAYGGPVDGQSATVILLSHPGNFRHPEPMRIWDKGGSFFNWAPSQLGDWSIEPGRDYVWRYRFVMHDGPIDADLAEKIWRDWAEPVEVKWE